MNTDNRTELPDHILELIAGKASRNLTREEERQLDNWLGQHPGIKDDADIFYKQMQRHRLLRDAETIDRQAAWEKIKQQTRPRVKPFRMYVRWVAIAAMFVLVVASAWYLVLYFQADEPELVESAEPLTRSNEAMLVLSNGEKVVLDAGQKKVLQEEGGIRITNDPGEVLAYDKSESKIAAPVYNTLIVPAGARYQLQLSDGTHVWMNAISEIEYPVTFAETERRIRLTGEAYFDVEKNPGRPFIIETNGYEIRVLGTSFNVTSYQNDPYMQTTLVSGMVEVTGMNGEKVSLSPGEMVMIDNISQEQLVEEVDTRLYTSWKEGVLYFNKVTLYDLSVKLGRWYDADFVFENPGKRGLIYSGAMENSRDLAFLLDLIEQTAEVNFIIEGKTVRVE